MASKIGTNFLRSSFNSFLGAVPNLKMIDKSLVIGAFACGYFLGIPSGILYAMSYKIINKKLNPPSISPTFARSGPPAAPVVLPAAPPVVHSLKAPKNAAAPEAEPAPAAELTSSVQKANQAAKTMQTEAQPALVKQDSPKDPQPIVPKPLIVAPQLPSPPIAPPLTDISISQPKLDSVLKPPEAGNAQKPTEASQPDVSKTIGGNVKKIDSEPLSKLHQKAIDDQLDRAAAQSTSHKPAVANDKTAPVKGSVSLSKPKPQGWFSRLFGPVPGWPPGIGNDGNTCFLASVIQFIGNSPLLSTHLPGLIRTDDKIPGWLREKNIKTKRLLQKILPLYRREKEEGISQSTIPISDLRALVPHSNKNTGKYAQQDAHEFLLGILGSTSVNFDASGDFQTQLKEYGELLKSPAMYLKTVKKTVAVPATTSLEGTRLERVSDQLAVSKTFSIEMPLLNVNLLGNPKTGGIHSLEWLLQNNYFNRTLLEKENYRSGKIDVPVVKDEISFDRAPEFLMVNLIRQGAASKQRVQIDGQLVEIDLEEPILFPIPNPVPVPPVLPWAPNGSDKPEKAEYTLEAYVVHGGGIGGGHYVAYLKNGADYTVANDGFVSAISKDRFFNTASSAYLLYYVKKPLQI